MTVNRAVGQKKIVGWVRFSVLMSPEEAGHFVIGKSGTYEEYRKQLFQLDRLEAKLSLFANLVLPSISNQDCAVQKNWFKLIVLASETCPSEIAQQLRLICASYPWLILRFVPAQSGVSRRLLKQEIADFCDQGDVVFSFRMDDDDALGKSFISEALSFCREEFDGFALSLSLGLAGLWDVESNVFQGFFELHRPKIALGLGVVSVYREGFRSIADGGNHMLIDRRFPTIISGKTHAFLRTLHVHGDQFVNKSAVQTERRVRRFQEARAVSAREAAACVYIADALLPPSSI